MTNRILNIIKEELKLYTEEPEQLDLFSDSPISSFKKTEFTNQFIKDSILKNEKINKAIVDDYVDIENIDYDINGYDDTGTRSTKINISFKIVYNEIAFELFFTGDIVFDLSQKTSKSTYYTPGSIENIISDIDYDNVNIEVYTLDGEEIPFNVPESLKNKFIESYIGKIIKDNL